MLDRFGREIRVGWEPREDEWLRAANTFPVPERQEAFRDIADMSGRSFTSVRTRGRVLLSRERQTAREVLQMALRKNWASESPPRRVVAIVPTLSGPRYHHQEKTP